MLVELLISSDVAKYCEFRSVTRILTLQKNKLEQVREKEGGRERRKEGGRQGGSLIDACKIPN